MAKFEVVLSNGKRDWLKTVESNSKRMAESDALSESILSGHMNVFVKTCTKVPTPKAPAAPMPAHVAEYLAGLHG